MRLGILTFHHTTNFGATLQAYALSSFLQQQGHQVEFINYQPEKAIRLYRDTLYFKARKSEVPNNFIREMKMRWFISRKLAVNTKKYSTQEGLKKFDGHYDTVIVGSDEVWNINSFRGVDTSYFLDFLPSKTRKISYAASFGGTTSLGEHKSNIKNLIDDFSHLSVRDSNSVSLLKQECQRESKKVLDPTFLINYDHLINQNKKSNEHILIYGKPSTNTAGYIKDLSRKLGIPIVSIGYANREADINRIIVGPEEWLNYFSRARYVFTSFYHGTIFSILFKKPFTVFSAEQKIIKLRDLLDDLNLSHRIYSESTESQPNFSEVDYETVFQTIQKRREVSQQYLIEGLRHGSY